MPVLASAGNDSDTSSLSGHFHGGQSLTSQFGILVGAGVALITASFLLQHFVLPWFSRQHPQYITRGSLWTGRSASKIPPHPESLPDRSWMPLGLGQGPGQLEKQATSWVISRGEASGTAPAGLGGSVEGSKSGTMEEKESTTPAGAWSRGVSTLPASAATQESSGLSYLGRIFPADAAAAEDQSDHVRIPPPSHTLSPLGQAGGVPAGSSDETGKDSMDDDHLGRRSGPGSIVAASRSTTPLFGQPEDMTDGSPGPVPTIGGRPSWGRALELNFTTPSPPPPLTSPSPATEPVYLAARPPFAARVPPAAYAQSVPTGLDITGAEFMTLAGPRDPSPEYNHAGPLADAGPSSSTRAGFPSVSLFDGRSYNKNNNYNNSSKGIPILPETSQSTQGSRAADGQLVAASRGTRSGSASGQRLTASSYPSTSPMLPPPPPTTEHPFDLSEIMFPGAGAVDGGVRVVHAGQVHNHGEDGPIDAHGDTIGTFDDSGAGWKRHTRVYGGGVCLACAAAGGGGFYGARVRPEDKRR